MPRLIVKAVNGWRNKVLVAAVLLVTMMTLIWHTSHSATKTILYTLLSSAGKSQLHRTILQSASAATRSQLFPTIGHVRTTKQYSLSNMGAAQQSHAFQLLPGIVHRVPSILLAPVVILLVSLLHIKRWLLYVLRRPSPSSIVAFAASGKPSASAGSSSRKAQVQKEAQQKGHLKLQMHFSSALGSPNSNEVDAKEEVHETSPSDRAPGGIAAVIYGLPKHGGPPVELCSTSKFLTVTTPDLAKYLALILGLEVILNDFRGEVPHQLEIFYEDEMVMQQLIGNAKVTSRHARPVHKNAVATFNALDKEGWTLNHSSLKGPMEVAHALARKSLEEKADGAESSTAWDTEEFTWRVPGMEKYDGTGPLKLQLLSGGESPQWAGEGACVAIILGVLKEPIKLGYAMEMRTDIASEVYAKYSGIILGLQMIKKHFSNAGPIDLELVLGDKRILRHFGPDPPQNYSEKAVPLLRSKALALVLELGANMTTRLATNQEKEMVKKLASDAMDRKASGHVILDDVLKQYFPTLATTAETTLATVASKKPTKVQSSSIKKKGPKKVSRQVLRLQLNFDGGSRGNPGVGGAGAVIYGIPKGKGPLRCLWSGSKYLGDTVTNNVAEYEGLLLGLQVVVDAFLRKGDVQLNIVGDSELVVRQILGEYRVNKEHLKPLHGKATELLKSVPRWHLTSVPRAENKLADHLANQAMDNKVTDLPAVTLDPSSLEAFTAVDAAN